MTDRPAAGQQDGVPGLIASLAAFPDELGRMLQGYPVDALKRPASDGGWGVIENLGHLRDWEEIYLSRVETILTQEHPELPEYDDQLWEIEHDYRGQDPAKVLERLRGQRQRLVDILQAVPAEAWGRTGQIGSGTNVTLEEVVRGIRLHDVEHARAIDEALA